MSKGKLSNKTIAGGAMIAGVIAILLVFVLLKPPSVERDPKTLCRSEGPSAITAILLDRTDSFMPTTKSDLETRIWNLLDKIEENHEISLFAVDPTHGGSLDPIIKVCSPGDPENVDHLTQSEAIIRRNWQQKFRAPLEEELRKLLTNKEGEIVADHGIGAVGCHKAFSEYQAARCAASSHHCFRSPTKQRREFRSTRISRISSASTAVPKPEG